MNNFFQRLNIRFMQFFKMTNSSANNIPQANIIEGLRISGNSDLVKIGDNVSFGNNVFISANAPISIGDHTMISVNVVFHTSTHNYNNHPMWIERIDKPIKVGKHVWIGIGVIICPGVVVGDYAVIGAGSVVVSNIPPKAIVAGNPARIIKYRDISEMILNNEVENYPNGSFVTNENYLSSENICKEKI